METNDLMLGWSLNYVFQRILMNMNDDYGLNSHFSGLEWLISKIWTAVISSADFLSPKMKNAFNCLEKQQKCLILQGSEKQ